MCLHRSMGLGPMLVARHFWQQLGLEAIIDSLMKQGAQGREVTDRALALVTNRVCEPTSEHGIARWLENGFCMYPFWEAMGAAVAR